MHEEQMGSRIILIDSVIQALIQHCETAVPENKRKAFLKQIAVAEKKSLL